MENAVDPGASPKPTLAVVALAGVDAATAGVLHDCFRQFGINTIAIAAQDTARLAHERFDACVLPLDDRAPQVLTAIRQSPENARSVIYGICDSLQDALRYSSYGINAVFMHPVERHAALRVVRATHLMVLHELRRYVRVPLVSEVTLQTGTEAVPGSTVEISTGGVSLHTRARLTVPQAVQAILQLPGAGNLSLRAVVCWISGDDDLAGLRFDASDQRRAQLRQWIDDYLGED